MEPYRSQAVWVPERPSTLVIACADGRWRPHVDDFLANGLKLDPDYDIVAVPGGVEPLTLLNWVPKDFNFLRRRLEMIMRAHQVHRVVAIAHQDCAWYRERRIGPITIDVRKRQLADLRQARILSQQWFPEVTCETYYARLDGDPPQAVFDAV